MRDQHNAAVVVRVRLLGPCHAEFRQEDGAWAPVEKATWEKYPYARPLLQRLFCSSNRRVERTTLMDDLWPRSNLSASVERYPADAAHHLRKVLHWPDLLKTTGAGSRYELEGQARLWGDVDEAIGLLKEAESLGKTSLSAFPLLEQADALFQRGAFLEGQGGQWSYARRGTIERMQKRCGIWLAQAYEQQHRTGQAEICYSRLLEDDPLDEDIWYHLIRLLHREGMIQQARRCYEDARHCFQQAGMQLSSAADECLMRLLAEPRPFEISVQAVSAASSFETNGRQIEHFSLSSPTQSIKGIIGDMDRSRRYLFQQALGTAGIAFNPPAREIVAYSLLERLTSALAKPSSIDESMLRYLEGRTHLYWQDRHCAALSSYDLMTYALEHLEKVTAFLEGSLPPSTRTRLCSIVSGAAQLLGELFFDMRNVQSEIAYKKLAILAAQEANNPALEAVAWGRMSFVWTYNNNPQEALKCVQNARHLALRYNTASVRAWLAAVEAEIQSILCEHDACLSALEDTTYVEDPQRPGEESYWLYFDRSLQAGYQGVCFQRLSLINSNQTDQFLTNAQQALKDALEALDSAVIQRRPTLLTDLAGVYVQQGDFQEAHKYAVQAITATIEMKSQTNVQRLLSLRQLEPWKDKPYSKDLEEHMLPLLKPGWYLGEA